MSSDRPRADAAGHVAVIAALGRLGRQGGWERLRAGESLAGLDRVDAELLASGGLVGRLGTDTFSVSVPELAAMDASTLGHTMTAELQRALDHLDRRRPGWVGTDPDLILSQGLASGLAAGVLANELLPRMSGSRVAMESGSGRFLDVGVGAGAVSAGLCRRYAGLTCVGLDVYDSALALAEQELARQGLRDRVELRQQSVVDLPDEAAFDLAWLPQPFIARADLAQALTRVRRALRPDRWIAVPLADTSEPDPFKVALYAHEAEMLGGGRLPAAEAEGLLVEAGFIDVLQTSWMAQTIVLARRP